MTVTDGVLPQHWLLKQWVDSLSRLPDVEVIWLEGSLVDGRAHPWSDIGLRLAIADAAFGELWEGDRTPLLEGLGEHLLLWNKGFIRAVTTEGIVAELGVRRSSELADLALYEWMILLNRIPRAFVEFKKLPPRSAAETWPGEPVSREDVHRRTLFLLLNLAIVAQDFHRGEVCAAAYTLDYLRHELFEVMYQRLGIRVGKRNKELSQIFPLDFVEDLKSTYTRPGEAALDLAALGAAQIRTVAALGNHLRALGEQVGGGFEPEWFDRLFEKTRDDIQRLVGTAPDSAR